MKRRLIAALTVCMLVSLFLSAGKPKLIGETEAKKTGLTFINQVFDVNETEAIVTYGTHAAVSYVDGEYVEKGDELPVFFYSVSVSENQYGDPLYQAMVNAETGVAYSARRSYSLVPEMTAEQRALLHEANGKGDVTVFDYASMDIDCKDFAREWIAQKFDLEAQILGFVDCGTLVDDNGAYDSFYVVIRDGTIYYLDMAWPQMTVLEFGILNQIRPYGSEP